MERYLFHLVTPRIFSNFRDAPTYFPPEFAEEGFIHCCFEHQIPDIVERYFRDIPEILVLQIDTELLSPAVKLEMAPVGEEYPHVYGEINAEAIVGTRKHAKNQPLF